MDLTEEFEATFTGKHFTSDVEFESACSAFKQSTGCRFAKRHMIYRQTPLVGLPDLLLKQGQFICSVSYCDAFFSVGSKKAGVYVTRFNMNHIHGPMPEETYTVKRDLLEEFRQYLPFDKYDTFEDFHSRLQDFQTATGSMYVKRHTVRWPANTVDKAHLVYARAHFECVNFGWTESIVTSRPVNSKRIGCKAYVVIQTYKGYVEIFRLNMQHNHGISRENVASQCLPSRRQDHRPKNNSYYPPVPVPPSMSTATSAYLSNILDKAPHELSNFDPFNYPNLDPPKQEPLQNRLKRVYPKDSEEENEDGEEEESEDEEEEENDEKYSQIDQLKAEAPVSGEKDKHHRSISIVGGTSRNILLAGLLGEIRRLAISAELDDLAEMSRQLRLMEAEWRLMLASTVNEAKREDTREWKRILSSSMESTKLEEGVEGEDSTTETVPILLQFSSSLRDGEGVEENG